VDLVEGILGREVLVEGILGREVLVEGILGREVLVEEGILDGVAEKGPSKGNL
jgi:hypothetical protein